MEIEVCGQKVPHAFTKDVDCGILDVIRKVLLSSEEEEHGY